MHVLESKKSRTLTNCMFVLVDVLENLYTDITEQLKRDGLELKHECKRHFSAAFKQTNILRREVSKCSLPTQLSYGEDADRMYELIMLMFDRIGDNNKRADEIINVLKHEPSVLGLYEQETE